MMNESDIISKTNDLLYEAVRFIEKSLWKDKYLLGVKTLQKEISAPCVLAIAGRVKAGKSFLINSLLGVDLAMTGTNETTATINIFKKGVPLSPQLPILCYFTDGTKEWKPKSFLDSLQGTDELTLELTSKIDKLIFYIDDNPLLEDVTLVDTPGIGANVGKDGDAHQIHTDAYFKLRERHHQETISLTNNADAVLYVFDNVPGEIDKDFITSLYNDGNGISALNGIGVLSKIDEEPKRIDNLPVFSHQFEKELFSILPTSAAISNYLLDKNEAIELKNRLHSGFKSEKGFKLAISSPDAFLYPQVPDCMLTIEDRTSILRDFFSEDIPWSAFRLMADNIYNSISLDETISYFKNLAGVEGLKSLIYNHFFRRSRILRCNTILTELYNIMTQIEYSNEYLTLTKNAEKRDMCISECSKLPDQVKEIVFPIISKQLLTKDEVNMVRDQIKILKDHIYVIQSSLASVNDCFISYQKLQLNKDQFSDSEFIELSNLLSGKSVPVNYKERYKYWSTITNMTPPNSLRHEIAKTAKEQYQKIMQDEKN